MKKQKNIVLLTIAIMLISIILPCTVNGADDIEWTDFTNATFKLKASTADSVIYAYELEVSNVTLNSDRVYTVHIHKKDDVITKTKITMYPDVIFENGETCTDLLGRGNRYNIFEMSDDIYITILETIKGDTSPNPQSEIVVESLKLERPELKPELGNRIQIYFGKASATRTYYWAPHNVNNSKNINIKLGKITDTKILQNIKDNKANALNDLLNYAKKSNNYIYTGTILYNSRKFWNYRRFN